MGLTLEQVVPWGRSLAEYIRMFALSPADLQNRILDCGSGPASFNAELTRQGGQVISCDPVYQFSTKEIHRRITDTYSKILSGVAANLHDYVWREISSPEQLGQVRMAAMQEFLADFEIGLQQQRYLTHALPTLPFADGEFALALCSHLLFTYSDHLFLDFHLNSIREMSRIATEVRIFPLLNLGGEPSPFLEPVIAQLQAEGYGVQLRQVAYEFQRGGDRLLQVRAAATTSS